MNWILYLEELGLLVGYLFCFFYWFSKTNKIDSFFIVFCVWGASNLLMVALKPLIYAVTGNIILDRMIWYTFFGGIDFLSILLIVKLHRFKSFAYSTESKIICAFYFLLLNLQLSRYVERMYFNTDYLKWLYVDGIQFINFIALLYFFFVVKSKKTEGLCT